MNPHSLPLSELCDIAIAAAREAGLYIQGADRNNLARNIKAVGSSAASQLVTEVDIRSEAIIRGHLQATFEPWDIAFVGEESSSSVSNRIPERLSRPYFWCVDPLDGTLPFVEGSSGYAVSIALVEKTGIPLIGVVYDPVDSTLLHAVRGQGVYRNQSSFSIESLQSSSLLAFLDVSFEAQKNYADVLEVLNACAKYSGLDGVTLVYGSGAVKNACQVLEHAAACYVKLPKPEDGGGSIWDYAATACIASEAGGWVSNIHGQPLELNREGSTFMNHQGVLYASSEGIGRYLVDALFPFTGAGS